MYLDLSNSQLIKDIVKFKSNHNPIYSTVEDLVTAYLEKWVEATPEEPWLSAANFVEYLKSQGYRHTKEDENFALVAGHATYLMHETKGYCGFNVFSWQSGVVYFRDRKLSTKMLTIPFTERGLELLKELVENDNILIKLAKLVNLYRLEDANVDKGRERNT